MIHLVREFHTYFNIYTAPSVGLPNEDIRNLRRGLLREEYEDEYIVAEEKDDLVEIADALGDMLYIIYGTCLTYGIPINKIFEEIHRSNMDKLCTTEDQAIETVEYYKKEKNIDTYYEQNGEFYAVYRLSDNKVLKRKGWQPPNIRAILIQHGAKI